MAVSWLNAAKGTSRNRVLGIRTELAYLLKMADSWCPGTPRQNWQEFRMRHNMLNERLSRYTFRPILYYDLDSGVWRYNTVPKKTRGPVAEVTLQGITLSVDEATAVAALVRLGARGELQKVRLCERCKKNWRVSERACDRFCSKRCSDADYQARPEFKDRRRKIQKDYRESEKRKAARVLAQLKGRN
jgi:endogenous inhibitor of DNA gyrase (YacG/DUF329 family)